jgi:hypothetical protein
MEPDSYRSLLAKVQRLRAHRRSHADALQAIDEILHGITQELDRSSGGSSAHRTLGAIPRPQIGTSSDGADTDLIAQQTPPGRQRIYNKLPQTGQDFVLGFIRGQGAPTTLDINLAWRAQGRGGAANNAIGALLKQGLIVREPLKDQRGSRYRVHTNRGVETEEDSSACPSETPALS